MPTISEVEQLAIGLPEQQRALLAARLLDSLRGVLHDDDEGVAEAFRRDAELALHPKLGISPEELDKRILSRR